jgi:hypothetical protein
MSSAEVNLAGYGYQEFPDDIPLSIENWDIDMSQNLFTLIPL